MGRGKHRTTLIHNVPSENVMGCLLLTGMFAIFAFVFGEGTLMGFLFWVALLSYLLAFPAFFFGLPYLILHYLHLKRIHSGLMRQGYDWISFFDCRRLGILLNEKLPPIPTAANALAIPGFHRDLKSVQRLIEDCRRHHQQALSQRL